MKVDKAEHMYEVGKVLGKFSKQLVDFNPLELFEIIEDFHNVPKRYRDFLETVEKDTVSRVKVLF